MAASVASGRCRDVHIPIGCLCGPSDATFLPPPANGAVSNDSLSSESYFSSWSESGRGRARGTAVATSVAIGRRGLDVPVAHPCWPSGATFFHSDQTALATVDQASAVE